jgi:hypothetical protein
VSAIGTGLATLGGDNRTITVAPGAAGNGLWNAGAGTLTVNATTIYGIAFSKSITLTVFNGFCVSPTGSDLAAGTTVAPFAKIPYAITQAVTKYKGAGRTAEVRVSLGSFTTNWGSATDRIIMVDGVSLLGGFPASYQTAGRAIDVRTKSTLTSITDESTTGGATLTNPNRAVSFDTAGTEDIGRATVLEGFFIKAGGGVYSAGVELNDATTGDSTTAAPTIRGNRIYAGTTATEGSIAIDALYHTAPLIQGNYLNDEHQTGDATGSTTMTYSYGVVMYQVQPVNSRVPTISGNTVWGALSGTGSSSCESTGIHVFGAAGGTIVIEANDVRAGPAYNSYSMIVQDGGTAEILNNRIVTHDPTSTSGVSRAIWKKGTMAMNVRNNTIIYGGDGFVAKTAQAIYIGSATGAVTIQNNIFRCAWMSQTAVHCIYEASAVTPTVQNNDWYDEAPHPSTVYYLYHDSGGSNYDDVATFQASGAATASGNLNVDPVLTTGQPNWWMNYRLQATSPASVKTGGLDGSGWGFATDKDGTARTVPWSMGCDEVN